MTSLVISPHLDDAVLSFGGCIAASEAWALPVVVATVFAGLPPEWYWPTPFDNSCGFSSSQAAVIARREEDGLACAAAGAVALRLGFLDGQYGLPQPEPEIVAELLGLMRGASFVAVPLGIMHPDHRLVAKCCRWALAALADESDGLQAVVYADLPGAELWPSHVPGALRGWERAGWDLEPAEWSCDLDAKARAREQYASQLRFEELAWENLTRERGWIAKRSEIPAG